MSKANSVIAAINSLIICTVLSACLFYLVTKGIILHIDSLTPLQKSGYDNSFVSLLGVSFFFISIIYIVYFLMIFLGTRWFTTTNSKSIGGLISALLTIYLLNAFTFGVRFSNPVTIMEFVIIGIAGATIPFLHRELRKLLEK